MKRLMVIAGGTWQIPIIKKAKELGYEVLNSNLYEDSPGFEFSDFTAVSDVRDKEKNLEFAKQYDIDGVLTDQSDIAVPTVAYVAENTGCKTIGSDMAQLFTNKFKMREFCNKEGFAVPEYRLCTTKEEALDFFENLNAKAIIKPLDSQSSRGIYVIENKEDIEEKFDLSMSFTSTKKYVLIERYITGTEFTVDGIVINGKHHTLAISEKAHFAYNKNIASELFFSYNNDKFDYDEIRRCDDALVERAGLPFGLTHAEYKYEDGKFYLIEIAARGGGTKISSDIVPYLSGIDNYEFLIKSALDEEIDRNLNFNVSDEDKKKCAVLKFLDIESKGKKIKSINGVDEIKNMPHVVDFSLEFDIGDVVTKAEDDRSRVGYFIVCAPDRQSVIDTSIAIKDTLKIEFFE